jgi:hypothetical protein
MSRPAQKTYSKPARGRYYRTANQNYPPTWIVALLMTSNADRPVRAGLRCMAIRLAAWLTLLLGTLATPPAVLADLQVGSRAYLPVIGAPALRFASARPPPDLTARPPAAAPPQPAAPAPTEGPATAADTPGPAPVQIASPIAPAAPPPEKPAEKPAPKPIIPDENRPRVRPEDFLPFFQIPAGAPDDAAATLVIPGVTTPAAPDKLPRSSATYRQQ